MKILLSLCSSPSEQLDLEARLAELCEQVKVRSETLYGWCYHLGTLSWRDTLTVNTRGVVLQQYICISVPSEFVFRRTSEGLQIADLYQWPWTLLKKMYVECWEVCWNNKCISGYRNGFISAQCFGLCFHLTWQPGCVREKHSSNTRELTGLAFWTSVTAWPTGFPVHWCKSNCILIQCEVKNMKSYLWFLRLQMLPK